MRKLIYIIPVMLCMLSCHSNKTIKHTKTYFSIADFFKAEISKLNVSSNVIEKIVKVNDSVETKTLKIGNWPQEFKIFTECDINKSSWDGEFQTSVIGDTTSYRTNNSKIPIKSVKIVEVNHHVKLIKIITLVNNYLYSSSDTLEYYPDSLYRIRNQQKIKLLKTRNYQITGKFSK